ncbi:MAG: thioredoxin reductase [Peptococcaceae bacterium BRH_c4b]|nr:MAG: thioredoxin reductase [Peptococcaceae bacterium BRH_c4b]
MTEKGMYDIAIVGGGPAGLSAAINTAARKKKTILFYGDNDSQKMSKAPKVDNYPGIPGVEGKDLRQKFLDHVREFDTELVQKKVQNVFPLDQGFQLLVKDGFYSARVVILATGVTVQKMLEGEEGLIGRGVSYCATCDGLLFKDKTLALIDHTREGVDEAGFLSKVCTKIFYFCMYDDPPSFGEGNIEVVTGEEPIKIVGDGSVSALQTDKRTIAADGVFLFRETYPPGELVTGLEIDENEIKVNRQLETNIKGLFAAGDCTGKPYQMAKAAGEGQSAALNAVAYIDSLQECGD